ncbi:MAG: phosphoenolpyruvate--protein phosphotransferase [Candidatus Omnitrophota bacterium]
MKILKGISISSGLTKGISCIYSDKADENIPHYAIDKSRVPEETRRLSDAFKRTGDLMQGMLQAAKKTFDERAGEIFKAHLMILEDPVLRDQIKSLIKNKLVNAEHAANDAFEDYIEKYEQSGFHFAELAHDVTDVKNRLLESFSDTPGGFVCPAGERHPVVVVSRRLTPSMVLHIPKENTLAFITEEGGFTSHATILARSYGVPIVLVADATRHIDCGQELIVDGSLGKVIVSPDKAAREYYAKKTADIEKKKKVCIVKKFEPAATKIGHRIKLKINISIPDEIELVEGFSYDGIGLLRTEFLFPDKSGQPSEKMQLDMYRRVLEKAGERPVTIRLLDIGGDKMPSYLTLPEQDNPDLGLRGARALEFFHDAYLVQMKAILQSSVYGNARILYPMVSDISDVVSFERLVSKAASILKKEKKEFRQDVKKGIMIETPAAAIMSQELLSEVDFANIGSNDLLQYTLAASRSHEMAERKYHILHPSLVRLMEAVAHSGNLHHKEICLCGEIASFEEFYPLLLAMGLRSFSVAPAKFADIKCHLLHEGKPDRSLLERFYKCSGKEELDELFQK